MRIFLHELDGKTSSPSIGRQLQDNETLKSYGIMPEVAFDVVTHQKGSSPADVIAVILLGEFRAAGAPPRLPLAPLVPTPPPRPPTRPLPPLRQ